MINGMINDIINDGDENLRDGGSDVRLRLGGFEVVRCSCQNITQCDNSHIRYNHSPTAAGTFVKTEKDFRRGAKVA